MERKKLAEGKTKIIWEDPQSFGYVLIESKDDITAGDGAKRNTLPGKAVHATETTCNVFKLLQKSFVPTHFCDVVGERTFRAKRLTMAPFEVVVRKIAAGSYLKRYPDIPEGTKFNIPAVEFFLKDDARHDPLLIYDATGERWLLFDAKRPLTAGFIEELPRISGQPFTEAPPAIDIFRIREMALRVFIALYQAWETKDVALVDLKLEFGTGDVMYLDGSTWVLGDVIDNDSWRIWPHGDKALMKDKQIYRNLLKNATPEDLQKIAENYAWVAKATRRFAQ